MQLTKNLLVIPLNQWLSIRGPQIGTISITWELAKIPYLLATPQTYSGLGTLGERPAVQVFRRSLRCPTGCALSCFSRVRLFAVPWTVARQASLSMELSSKNPGVGCHFLLRGIFLTWGWSRIACTGRWILCHRAIREGREDLLPNPV